MKKLYVFILLVISCLSIHAQNSQRIADSNNLFAFKLYAELNKENQGNLFFSPFSISTALAMTYVGARNETEKQMSQTMHFSRDQSLFHVQYKSYLEKIETDTGRHLIMKIANSIWVDSTCKLLDPFSETVKDDYNSEARNVDFKEHTEQARQEINAWVESKTDDKIQELIEPGIMDASTRVVLVNAIYFNGKWNIPFSKDSTKKDFFYTDASAKISADFMNKASKYKYYEDSVLQAIEIPYAGDTTSMVVLLPKEIGGINSMEKQLDNTYYSNIITSLLKQRVKLELPKFETTEEFNLSNALMIMGMPVAFSSNADFSGMSDESLCITAVIHKAFVDVSEEGTEAAAATAVIMGKALVMRPRATPVFVANHPFIFIIKDNATGSILFMGKITNPSAKG